MKNQVEIEAAIEKYGDALKKRMIARTRLAQAQKADQQTRNELTSAKEHLRNLEIELTEAIDFPGLISSHIPVNNKVDEQT